MRAFLIAISIASLISPALGQSAPGDSTKPSYAPLDSLDAGLDLALKALIMNRGDLTFRYDYLEPDPYKLPMPSAYMQRPLSLIRFAELCLTEKNSPLILKFIGADVAILPRLDHEKKLSLYQNVRDSISRKMPGALPISDSTSILKAIIDFAEKVDIRNSPEMELYITAQLDSLAEGFTFLLEARVGDEFLNADQLDSLEQFTELWAERLSILATDSRGRLLLVKDFDWFLYYMESLRSGKPAIPPFSLKTEFGQIIVGDTTDNHYKGDLFVVIDPGGDDTYDIELDGTGHQTYIIDYGGNDTYNMPKNRISPYFFGSNVIIDYSGDDSYNAGSWTLGAGLFGVGFLWDMKGNDRYFGDTFTQGAGCFGIGVLRDDAGNDTYQAALYSQGFGFVEGIGMLIDSSGNDNYFAGGKYKDFIRYNDHYISMSQGFGFGWRPKMSGGVGLLIDKSGNDVYVSDIYGQGASYWYSLGALVDGGGNDQYLSFQYAQGNGTHMSLGILYDVGGDDVYSAKGVSQGCGHDRAAGLLIDLDGNDNYNAYDLCQGAGSANGLGLIADIRGNDAYIVRSDKNTQGYGNPRREYGSIGIFLDLGGKDGYSGGLGRDGHWWTNSMWGVGIDK